MAKAKILADRISITSEVLTDENLEKVSILSPSVLTLVDELRDSELLFTVAKSDCNTFTNYGAAFKDGKTLGNISESILNLDKEVREEKIKTILTSVLTRINAVEEQVENYLENAIDLADDVEFLD
jgi:hypothetical protein